MKKKIILLFSSIVTIHSFGQNNILKGKVFFLSSGNKPAVGVEVSGTIKGGLKANSVFTVDNGSFRLLFPNARDGMHIDLIVGNSDKNGTNIEVVNNKELETLCKIPADPTEEFGVIVCPKGGRDLAAQKYYKIIKTSTDIELKKIKTQFDRLLNQEKKDYQKIKELSEKIAVLEKHSDSLIIYKAALQIASINTDRASARVLNYLNLLNKGNLVQEAREALSIEKASTELNSAATGFENAIQELEIRAEASVSIFDFNDAVMCYDTIIKYSEKLNVDQVKIAYKYLAAGYISFDAGKYTEALNYQLKNEYIFRQHLDSNDLQLAISFNDIAATYLALGQFHKALRYEKKSITIREKSLPSMHPELAILYNNLGMIYEELGQYDEAFKYIRKSLEIDEPIYGSNSPKLEITYNNLAVLYLHTGEYEFALNLYKKLIATREIGREEKTPGNATTYNNIAEAYLSLGELSIAQDYQYKAIAIREEILGLKHPDLAVSYNNISQILLKQGNVKESLKYCDKSIQIFEGSFDSTHPLLATSYNNAALVHIDIGEYEKALSYQEKALDIQKKIFDSIHPALATSYNNLGLIYLEMDQYKTALLYQRKAIFLESKITPINLDKISVSYDNLARIYRGLHNYQEALIYHDSAISISEERFGQMHSRLAVLYHNKSLTLQDASRYEEALEYANKALTIELLTSAPNSPSLVKTYFSLGSSYASLNNYEKSLVYYQKAILIQENENINYPLLVKIYRGAIPIYDKLGENKIALEYQIKLLDLEEHKVTTSNADLGISYNELGRFYNNLKNYSAAIRSYSRSVELSPELKKSHFYLNIGVAYCDNSQFTEAFTAFKNYEKLFPNKPISFCNWVIYYSLKRDKVNALANLEKALRLGFSNKNFLMTNHRFNYIRKEPVFIKLIQEMK